MTEGQPKKRIVSLFRKKQDIEKEIKKLQNQLVQQLCPKHKQECEPEYCTFRITDTCLFLKEWRKILEEAQVPKETKYDLFINFVEKVLEDKGVSEKSA